MSCHCCGAPEGADTANWLCSNDAAFLSSCPKRKTHTSPDGNVRSRQGWGLGSATSVTAGSLGLLRQVHSEFMRRKTTQKSARFPVEQCSSPYPGHYSPAFAFSAIPYPHSQRITLRFTCPKAAIRAYHVPCLSHDWVRSLPIRRRPYVTTCSDP